MEIELNELSLVVGSQKSIRELLLENKYGRTIVVFLNGKKMLMKEVDKYMLLDGDVIKVFRPLSGG